MANEDKKLNLEVSLSVDNASLARAKKALADFEARYQKTTSGKVRDTQTGKFVSRQTYESTVKNLSGNVVAAEARTAAQGVAELGASMTHTLESMTPELMREVGTTVKHISKEWGVGMDEAAQILSNGFDTIYGDVKMSKEDLLEAVKLTDSEKGDVVRQNNKQPPGRWNRSSPMMMGITGYTTAMAGMNIANIGMQLLKPIQNYVKYAGLADANSAAWLRTTQELNKSLARIGRAFSGALIPYLETVADLVEKIAKIFEEHPGLAALTGGVAIGLVGVGKLMQILGSTLSAIAAMKSLGMLSGLSTAAGGAGLKGLVSAAPGALKGIGAGIAGGATAAGKGLVTALTSTLGGILSGIFAGVAANDFLSKTRFGEMMGIQKSGKFATVAAYGVGKTLFPGDEQKALAWAAAIGRLTGVMEDAEKQTEDLADEMIPEAALQAFIQFEKDRLEAEEQYEKDRGELQEEYAKDRLDIEEQFEKDRASIIKSYNDSLVDLDKQFKLDQVDIAKEAQSDSNRDLSAYYERRRKLAEEYQIDVQRAEEDHQKEIRRMMEDHDLKVRDLADARDAFGIVREQEAFELERRRAEEDYRIEAARRSEDFARRMAELEQEKAQERAERQVALAQRLQDLRDSYLREKEELTKQKEEDLADLETQRQEALELRAKQHKEDLADLTKNFQEARTKRIKAFNDQLRDIDAALLGEVNIRQGYYNAMTKQLVAWLGNMQGQFESGLPGYPTHHSGGYTRSGLALLADDEYVLAPDTVSKAEELLGSSLTQSNILSALSGGGKSVSIQANLTVDSRDPIASMKSQMTRIAEEVLIGALGG